MQSSARVRRGELTQDVITTHECRVGCIRTDGACGISSRALAHSLVTARKARPFEGPQISIWRSGFSIALRLSLPLGER
jgi:hypothetical protein